MYVINSMYSDNYFNIFMEFFTDTTYGSRRRHVGEVYSEDEG